jgi:hypothetical protein
MAGTILDRQLSRSRVQFAEATHADDAEIRGLLRETPMRGAISITLEREPNYFADAEIPGESRQTIVARENDKVVCVGSCVTRDLFVNGRPRRVGYLGGLRLAATHAGRFDILRRGYQFFSELQHDDPAEFYFTSIASDNRRARDFLEASIRGLPKYEFLCDYATLVIPSKLGKMPSASTPLQLNSNPSHQFASVWTEQKLTALERLGFKNSYLVSDKGECAGLWDQRWFKQTVIRGYSGWLRFARPIINTLGLGHLPEVGESLSNAIVCGLNAPDPNTAVALLSNLRSLAAKRGISYISLGLSGNDPRMATIIRTLPCRIYNSRIYLVRWPDIGGAAADLDARLISPELAFL